MSYKFHHVGLYCSDFSLYEKMFCQYLGHGKGSLETFCGVELQMLTQRNNDLQLALFASAPKESWFNGRPGIQYLALEVDHLDKALTQLQSKGVELLKHRERSASFDYAVLKSVEGLPLIILQQRADAPDIEPSYASNNPFGFMLNHAGILSDRLSESESFWRDNFGLHRMYFNNCDGSGFMGLADTHWKAGQHIAFVELLSPPNILNVDQQAYDLDGVNYHHLNYYCKDVPKAWQSLVDAGFFPTQSSFQEAGTGAITSFVQGPDHLDFEIAGGAVADGMIQADDIRLINEEFSDSAADINACAAEMKTPPEGYRFMLK